MAAYGAVAGPLGLLGATFAAIGEVVNYFLGRERKQRAADVVLFEDWGDKVEFAHYSAYRDGPDSQGIFGFHNVE